MHLLLLTIMSFSSLAATVIFDFANAASADDWQIVNDTVMGGRSSSSFELNDAGQAIFSGKVSLENNGGFCSLRYGFEKIETKKHTHVALKVRGDGKDFQFRLKANESDYFSYIHAFETSGEWEEILIPLADFYASFRGRTLDMPNFSNQDISEIRFLIGNKKAQNFKLTIEKIELR